MTFTIMQATTWFGAGAVVACLVGLAAELVRARRAARRPPPMPVDAVELREVAGELRRLSRRVAALGERAAEPAERARASA